VAPGRLVGPFRLGPSGVSSRLWVGSTSHRFRTTAGVIAVAGRRWRSSPTRSYPYPSRSTAPAVLTERTGRSDRNAQPGSQRPSSSPGVSKASTPPVPACFFSSDRPRRVSVRAELVERIRAERLAGGSVREIADGLNADRIPTARGRAVAAVDRARPSSGRAA
jgi:hypothetical protein